VAGRGDRLTGSDRPDTLENRRFKVKSGSKVKHVIYDRNLCSSIKLFLESCLHRFKALIVGVAVEGVATPNCIQRIKNVFLNNSWF
jgi:hypothetical protein